MDYGTLTTFYQDSCMAKRETVRRRFDGQCHRPSSIKTYSFQGKLQNPNSPVAHFIQDKPNATFGDLFTAVLGSKLTKQSPPSSPSPNAKVRQRVSPPIPAARSSLARMHTPSSLYTSSPNFLEPTTFECRSRDDREQQLDMRCFRIIQKLEKFTDFQDIVRRFFNKDKVHEGEGDECCGRFSSMCGIRAHLLKVLRLKEPRRCAMNASHNTLLMDGNDFQTQEEIETPTAFDFFNKSESFVETNTWNDAAYVAFDDKERGNFARPMICDGGGGGGGSSSISPETLLRRLARSISTRLSHKRALLVHAIAKYQEVQSHSQLIQRILRKTADVFPKMTSNVDVCFFRLSPQLTHPSSPPYSSSSSEDGLIDMRICKVASAYPLPAECRAVLQETAASNLVARFERLCSSQNAVMKLLCQLACRSYYVGRKLNVMSADAESNQISRDFTSEMDAIMFSLRNRKQQLELQIKEAQNLRQDLENTKSRLLTGLQYQFYVINTCTDALPSLNGYHHTNGNSKKCDNMDSDSSLTSIISLDKNNDYSSESAVCLAEFISKHLTERVQCLLIKLTLETEINDDQETVDCIGDRLRLVSSFSP